MGLIGNLVLVWSGASWGLDLLGPGHLCGRGLVLTAHVAFAGAVIVLVAQRKVWAPA